MITELIIIFVLIVLNGILSASEIAILSSRKTRLQSSNNKKAAKTALELKDSPNEFLSTIQIGITLIGVLTGFFGGGSISTYLSSVFSNVAFLKPYSEELAITVVVLFITYFSLVIGELVPKRIGMSIPEKYALLIAQPMSLLSKIVKPFVWFLSLSTQLIVKLLNIKSTPQTVTEEEIKAMVDEGVDSGVIEGIEHDIVDRLLSLGDKKAYHLMTHRNKMVFLDLQDTAEEQKNIILDTGHSVYPVIDGNTDNILGVVYTKGILNKYLNNQAFELKDLIQIIPFVYENSSSYSILEQFKKMNNDQAIVIDEYGAMQGIISLKDIVADLVGYMSEADLDNKPKIVKREDGSFIVDGALLLEDFYSHFELNLSEEDEDKYGVVTTLGGLVFLILDRYPKEGDKVSFKNINAEILDMDLNRIDKLLIQINNQPEDDNNTVY